MMGWQALTKSISFFAAIWSARCLGPESLGKSGLVLSVVAQISLFTTLNIEALLVREYKKSDPSRQKDIVAAYSCLRFVLSAFFVISGLTLCFLFLRHTDYVLGAALAIPFFVLNANNAAWLLMAKENMPANSRAGAVGSLASAAVTFLVFRPNQPAFSDIVILGLASLVAFLITWRTANRSWTPPFWHFNQLSFGIKLAVEGKWLFISGILIYVYTGLEQPLLGYLYSVDELGKYRTAVNLTANVQQFLGMLPMLYFPRFVEWSKSGGAYLWKRQIESAKILSIVAIAISTGAFIGAPIFYRIFYDSRFWPAAIPFALLVTSKCIVLVAGVFAWGLWAQHKDKMMLTIVTIAALISLSSNALTIPTYGMSAAAATNCLSELTILMFCFYFSKKLANS
jgi:O-antigen/teichoic acid export membrane protein